MRDVEVRPLSRLPTPKERAIPDFTKRREWHIDLEGRPRTVMVEYAMLTGFLTISVDGARVARAWREWQTVFGGANLAVDLDGHQVAARITQPYGAQEYKFALSVDGQVQPGSDDLPPPSELKRSNARRFAGIAVVIFVVTFVASVAMVLLRP